ncbi:hypothetical protein PoB_003021000 [Plakobranchus ocellatus]|uniref:Uncharacterized protein n=1 Tax=Plakobranchus ocellatus TaxID=259542 RepID=A0AAV4AA68_9GAST|nr:hypothetical protein PoB_003021000 [Plakobranchus ocellatus]
MSNTVISYRAGRRTDADFPHVLPVQEHEQTGLTCHTAVHARTGRASSRADWVSPDDRWKEKKKKSFVSTPKAIRRGFMMYVIVSKRKDGLDNNL